MVYKSVDTFWSICLLKTPPSLDIKVLLSVYVYYITLLQDWMWDGVISYALQPLIMDKKQILYKWEYKFWKLLFRGTIQHNNASGTLPGPF